MKKFLFSLPIILFFSIPSFCQEINELIPPINLHAGEEKSFLVNDLFYSGKEYKVTFPDGTPDDSLLVSYETENGELKIQSLKTSEKYGVLPFSFYNKQYHILYKTQSRQTISFSYKSWEPVKRVSLFGSFNGWSRLQHPMKDENGDGIYSITVPLEPGRYEYKFFVEPAEGTTSLEVIDSLNSEKVPNGLGDWNSIIEVKPPYSGKAYLHTIDYISNEANILFSFYYESETKDEIETLALLDNELIPKSYVSLEGKKIFLNIPSERLKGKRTLRVAVNEYGRTSNLQIIMLKDGKPLGKEDSTWYDAIIYSIMIDRFCNGDTTNDAPVVHPELDTRANYQGGDFQGIINKLDEGYFDSLGINTFWLSPVVDNTNNAYEEYPPPHRFFTGYHGYWPIDPERVEEHFGNMELLKELIDKAHQHGIKVLLDYVAHHVHIEHPFWKEHRNWFGTLELPDGRKNLRLWDEFRLTTWFEPYMPSFDYEGSEEALEVMTNNAVWWLKETGADGFRHDAVKHVPNKYWRLLTKKIKEELEIPQTNPSVRNYYQIGETFGSYDLVSSYVNNGQLNAQFNFNLYDTAIPTFTQEKFSFENLDKQMQKSFNVFGVNHLMGNVMDSHDKVRFMAYADGDINLNEPNAAEIGWSNPPKVDNPLSYEKLKLYLVYLLTIPGLPVIYYGDEFGMTGAADPDNRRMMRFGNELSGLEKKTLQEVSKIIHLRNQHPALRYGDFQTLLADENVYVYLRSDLNERILVAINKSNEEQILDIDFPGIYNLHEAKDILSGGKFVLKDSRLQLKINKMDYMILILNK
jgi:cyclomaltodextrinase